VQSGAHENGMRKLLGVGEGANDVRRFNTQDERRCCAAARNLDRRGGARDGIANPLWAGQYGFHDVP
jgi:hypothetical protein